MTTITIDRAVLLRALEALRPATAPNGAKRDAAFEELRAALAAPATAPDLSAAYIGAREDLAVWKKRALEAEETARQLNRALAEEVNGPTFMGEPVLPATAQDEQIRKDAERYRWCVKNNLVLAGGTREFGWQIAPVGSEWNRFIDAAMKGTP